MENRGFSALSSIFRFSGAGGRRSMKASESRSALANPLQKIFAVWHKRFQRDFIGKSRVFSTMCNFRIFGRRRSSESECLIIAFCPCKSSSKKFCGAADAFSAGFHGEIAAFQHLVRFSDFRAPEVVGVQKLQNCGANRAFSRGFQCGMEVFRCQRHYLKIALCRCAPQ